MIYGNEGCGRELIQHEAQPSAVQLFAVNLPSVIGRQLYKLLFVVLHTCMPKIQI